MTTALTLSQSEALDGALQSYLYAERADDGTATTVLAVIRSVNRLIDAIADVDGYARAVSFPSYADLRDYAAERVTATLMAA